MNIVEKCAKELFDSEPHKLLERGGFPTDWKSQPTTIHMEYKKKARTVINRYIQELRTSGKIEYTFLTLAIKTAKRASENIITGRFTEDKIDALKKLTLKDCSKWPNNIEYEYFEDQAKQLITLAMLDPDAEGNFEELELFLTDVFTKYQLEFFEATL